MSIRSWTKTFKNGAVRTYTATKKTGCKTEKVKVFKNVKGRKK